MKKEEIGSIVGIGVLCALLILAIYLGIFSMDNVLFNAQWFIYAGIIGLFTWGWGKRIRDWFRDKNVLTSSHHDNYSIQTQPSTEVTRVLGRPIRTDDNGVQIYDTRDQLPSFRELMNFATKKVRMSALTFTILRLNHEDVLRETAARKVQMTFLLLDPASKETERQTSLYKGSEDLREQIQKSLDMFCRLKSDYPNQIVVRTYKVLSATSLTVIDKTLAKEEIRKVDSDANSRPNKIAFRKDYKRFFNDVSNAYENLVKISEEYPCKKNDSNSV